MSENTEIYLDEITNSFRNKIVNIITVPVLFSPIHPELVPSICTGIFLCVDEYGIWILSKSKERQGKKELFYHDKIVKIEEVQPFRTIELEPNEKEIVRSYYDRVLQSKEDLPDVPDPSDTGKVSEMLHKVRQIINEKKSSNDFLQTKSTD